MLKGKTIVLGITGGIAAYKAADLASKLTQAGAKVEVIMTEAAKKLSLRSLCAASPRPVVTDMFELAEYSVEHVAGEAADVVVIAPARNTITRLAAVADDMLSTLIWPRRRLWHQRRNDNMYRNSVTQKNVKKRGFALSSRNTAAWPRGKSGRDGWPRRPSLSMP
jgi:phosphopantothenoylcysteine decarboxylase/phosphopantothenate--cysteine ligase